MILSAIFVSMLIIGLALSGRIPLIAGDGASIKVMPGEFEEQEAIWVMWPSDIYNDNESPVDEAMTDIVRKLAPHVLVNIMAANDSESAQIRKLLKLPGDSCSRVHYFIIPHQSIWTRDVGPLFVKDKNGRRCVVDFRFNNYGRNGDPYYIANEGQVDDRAAELLRMPVVSSSLVSEGGSIESNGKGTIILTEAVALKHNPGLTREQIEKEYKRVLGARKIIWLKNGLAEDKITGGHVDEFARFADPRTILLAEVLPQDLYSSSVARLSHKNLEENYRILVKAVDQDNNPFKIIRVPMPPTLYQETESDSAPTVRSYLNYVITNGAVLVQTYWKPGRSEVLKKTEEEALDTFSKVFPGREVIGIDTENINRWGGGIHCVTQHMPADN